MGGPPATVPRKWDERCGWQWRSIERDVEAVRRRRRRPFKETHQEEGQEAVEVAGEALGLRRGGTGWTLDAIFHTSQSLKLFFIGNFIQNNDTNEKAASASKRKDEEETIQPPKKKAGIITRLAKTISLKLRRYSRLHSEYSFNWF